MNLVEQIRFALATALDLEQIAERIEELETKLTTYIVALADSDNEQIRLKAKLKIAVEALEPISRVDRWYAPRLMQVSAQDALTKIGDV